MSAAAELAIDKPLQILQRPTRDTLQQLSETCESYLDDPSRTDVLARLHGLAAQLQGVFVILDEPSATALMREIRALAESLDTRSDEDVGAVQSLLPDAVLEARRYFEWLLQSGEKPFFDLTPLLRRLRKMRTGTSEAVAAVPERVNIPQLALTLRPQLQRILLELLQGEQKVLQEATTIFAQLRQVADEPGLYRLWWLAEATFVQASIASEAQQRDLKQLLRDLDQCLRRLVEGARQLSGDLRVPQLTIRLEQRLAGTPQGAARLREYAVYQAGVDSVENAVARQQLSDGSALLAALKALREELGDSQYRLDQFLRAPDHQAILQTEPWRLHNCSNVLRTLGLNALADLLQRQIPTLVHWQTPQHVPGNDIADQTAGAFILVQSCLEALSEQIERHGRVIITAEVSEADIPWVPQRLELYRARREIARESAEQIDRAWILAMDYIDNGGTPAWESMHGILRHVTSGFAMLDDQRAVTLTRRLEQLLQRFTGQSAPPAANPRDAIALFADITVSLSQLLGLLGNAISVDEQPLLYVEGLIDQLEAVLNAPPSEPTESIEQRAAPVPERAPEPSAVPAVAVPRQAAPPASPRSVSPAVTDEDFDPEIFEIFLEEAQGEAERIAEWISRWSDDPTDNEALGTIRRAFHTLKGSGRMVGEQDFGEFAWAYEGLLNRVLEGRMPPTGDIIEAVRRAAEAMLPVLQRQQPGLGDDPQLQALMEHARALSEGRPSMLPKVAAESAAEPLATPVPEEMVTESAESTEPLITADPELLDAFLEESGEILDAADTTLQQWRQDTGDTAQLNNLRRGMHTLKGGARLTGLSGVGDLAHAAENILEAIVKEELGVDNGHQELLQQALDRLNLMLEQARQGQNPAPATALMTELKRRAGEEVATASAAEDEKAKTAALRDAFILESADILQASDLTLRRWQQDTANRELLKDLERDLQTLRDNARLAGIGPMGELVAALSTLLESVMAGQLNPNAEVISVVENGLDAMGRMLDQLRRHIKLTPADDVRNAIQELLQGRITTVATGARAQRHQATPGGDSIRVDAWLLNALSNQVGESSIFRARIEQGVNTFHAGLGDLDQTIERLRLQMRRLEINAEARIMSRRDEAKHGREFDPLELDRFSELQQLSRSLMEAVDDLSNIQLTLDTQTQKLNQLLHEQNKVNRGVQESLTQTRMIRFASVVPRLRRLVRQIADELGKQVELVVDARDDKVDRTVLDHMIAALEHMLRNAVDHGIETPADRQAAGKPETGTIQLQLTHEGTEVLFTLQDDGAGLNFDAIRRKAESQDRLPPGQKTDEQTLINLLLQPGFSTATRVTQVSGRGVGMDVVNESIRSLRGSMRITSEAGRGTRISVRLPSSLELTQALLIRAAGGIYAIPLLSIEAVKRLAPDELRTYMAGEPVQHGYAGRSYPLHGLGILFGQEPEPFDTLADMRPPVLLFRSGEASMALLVDSILGRSEIVVKPIAPQVSTLPGIAGATVLADGTVAVVLDLASLVRNVTDLEHIGSTVFETREETVSEPLVMVVDDSITMRKITTRLLERNHYRVVVAKDGVEAVDILARQLPDAVIMDIEMPRMDGFEVLTHIRNQPQLEHLPVIMVTSRSGQKHRDRAERLGISDYLVKPYQSETMLQAVRQCLRMVAA